MTARVETRRAGGGGGFAALDAEHPRPGPGEVFHRDIHQTGELLLEAGDARPPRRSKRRAVLRFASAVPGWGLDGAPALLDMAGADLSLLNSGRAPLLLDHYQDFGSVVGVVERAWIEGDAAFASVRFAESVARGREAWELVREGVLSNVSMGFSALRVADADPRRCRVRWWRPFELSLCAVPADWKARVWRPDPSDPASPGAKAEVARPH